MDADAASVRLTIPAKPEYITLGRLALTAIARVRPVPDETLNDLKLALTEACTNSVRHAYRDGGGTVEIEYRLEPDRLVVEVTDDGVGGADTENGSGLRGLADRVEALGGRLRVWSPLGEGTRVSAEIPCAS